MRRFLGVEHLKRVRELGPGPNSKLAVGVGEMDLDGLRCDKERLRNVAVGSSLRRHTGHPGLTGSERFGPTDRASSGTRPGGEQLIARPLRQESSPATRGEIESLMQRIARRNAIVRSPQGPS